MGNLCRKYGEIYFLFGFCNSQRAVFTQDIVVSFCGSFSTCEGRDFPRLSSQCNEFIAAVVMPLNCLPFGSLLGSREVKCFIAHAYTLNAVQHWQIRVIS